MEEMSIQTTKINMLKEKMSSLETHYKLAKIMHKEEMQKDVRMTERIKAMGKDLTLKEPLGQLWNCYGPISLTLSMIFGHIFR